MDLSHDKKALILSCLDDSVKLYEVSSGDILNSYNDHKNSSHKTEARFMWDDNNIISGSEDGKIYVYNVLKVILLFIISETICQENTGF